MNLMELEQGSPLLEKLAGCGVTPWLHEFAGYLGSLHLYEDYITLERRDGKAICVDPHDVASAFSTIPLSTGALPPGCLFWSKLAGQERLGIYVKPQVWPVSVAQERLTWHVPMPGLVFVGHGQDYYAWAVKETVWPGPETQLFMAPVPNIGELGVCRGDAPFPQAAAGTIRPALELFFSSGFNNHLDNGKCRSHPDSVLKLWRELSGKKQFPEKELVVANKTLREVIDGSA